MLSARMYYSKSQANQSGFAIILESTLPKRTRRHWAFKRTCCHFNRATEFRLLRFAAQCRLRAGSPPSSPLASVCRFAPNEPRRSLGIPSQSERTSMQNTHPFLHHVPKATSRAQPQEQSEAHIRSSITCRRRLPALSRRNRVAPRRVSSSVENPESEELMSSRVRRDELPGRGRRAERLSAVIFWGDSTNGSGTQRAAADLQRSLPETQVLGSLICGIICGNQRRLK